MKKSTAIWLITATALTLAGIVLFAVTMSLGDWDFMKLSTTRFTTTTHEIDEKFENVIITASTADIKILPAEDGKARVVCHEDAKQKHSVEVIDGTLKISATDSRAWYEMIGISFETSTITLYLPNAATSDINISLTTGDAEISDVICQNLTLNATTSDATLKNLSVGANIVIDGTTGDIALENTSVLGDVSIKMTTSDITLENVAASGNVNLKNTTGDANLKNVIISGNLTVTSGTGDVRFNRCDAENIYVTVRTGDVKGNLLSDKIFYVTSTTGDTKYPNTQTGGRCEITTTTGDVNVTIQK